MQLVVYTLSPTKMSFLCSFTAMVYATALSPGEKQIPLFGFSASSRR